MKKYVYLGLSAGLTSGLLGFLYVELYEKAMWVDFSTVLNFQSIIGASFVGCLLMSLSANIWDKVFDQKFEGWLHIILLLFSGLTFAGPLLSDLPLEIESPELFPGAAMPLHLLPLICWLALKPFFNFLKQEE